MYWCDVVLLATGGKEKDGHGELSRVSVLANGEEKKFVSAVGYHRMSSHRASHAGLGRVDDASDSSSSSRAAEPAELKQMNERSNNMSVKEMAFRVVCFEGKWCKLEEVAVLLAKLSFLKFLLNRFFLKWW